MPSASLGSKYSSHHASCNEIVFLPPFASETTESILLVQAQCSWDKMEIRSLSQPCLPLDGEWPCPLGPGVSGWGWLCPGDVPIPSWNSSQDARVANFSDFRGSFV